MSSPLLMGVDLGTSSTRMVIIARDGHLLSLAAQEYGFDTPCLGWAEQDPDVWRRAALETMQRAVAEAGISPEQIEAIGLSGQMQGTICLDRWGCPLHPAIIWADQRSGEQVRRIYREFGVERLGECTANPLDTDFMLASWLWLRENEPHVSRATAYLLLPKDYVQYCLTGKLRSESSDASSTLLFDTLRRCWSNALLEALGIDPGLLPPVHESAEIAGGLKNDTAAICGLRAGTPVVHGGSDQSMQALGCIPMLERPAGRRCAGEMR